MKNTQCISISGLIIGVLFFAIGIAILIILPILQHSLVLKNVGLKPDSFAEKQWAHPEYSISMDFWMYNITNTDDILFNGAKPILNKKGPYSFVETIEKDNISRNESNGYLEYNNRKTYVFNQHKSCDTCRESDMFTVPNVPYLTAMNIIYNMPNIGSWIKTLLQTTLLFIGEHPFTIQNVSSLLFNGYKDPLFTILQKLKMLPEFKDVPDKMGFFYPQNHSQEEPIIIDSGQYDPNLVGRILSWNGKSAMDFWTTDKANMINGTDGTIFRPFLNKSSILRMFVPDICRSVFATFHSESVIDGISAYKFYVPEPAFDAANPENLGFCQFTDQIYYPKSQEKFPNTSFYCLPSGLLNITKCRFGAPIVLSNPNFLFSTDEVIESVTGLQKPNVLEDATFFDIEPNTGTLLNVKRMIQVNVALYKLGRGLKNLKPVIIPVLMLNESAHVGQAIKDQLYSGFVTAPKLAHGFAYAFLILGLILIVTCSSFLIFLRLRRRQTLQMDDTASTIEQDSPSSASSTATLP